MTNKLIEALARAIAKAKGIEICSDASYRFSTFGPLAEACLKAISDNGYAVVPREPTHGMVEAGHQAMGGGDDDPTFGDAWNCYEAMINATTTEES